MSIETSIDALVRDFEIEDQRDDVPTAAKQKVQEADAVQAPVVDVPPVEPENPMSFLDSEGLGDASVPPAQGGDELVEEEPTLSIAEMKEKAKADRQEIMKLESDVKTAVITQRYDLEDRAFMKAQLKSLIADNRAVMDCIESQLKIGVNPHLFDIYANLSKTVADNVMRLAKIDETITNYKIIEDKGTGNIKHDVNQGQPGQPGSAPAQGGGNVNMQINNYNLGDSSDLLKFVKSLMPKVEKVKQEDLPKFNLN